MHYADSGKICAVEKADSLLGDPPLRDLTNLDLLILDYNLIPGDDTDSSKAREIISKLADSPTFNIIVVYTAEGNIEKVAIEIASSLFSHAPDRASKDEIAIILDEILTNNDSIQESVAQLITNAIKSDYLSGDIHKDCDLFRAIAEILPQQSRKYTKRIAEYFISKQLTEIGRYKVNSPLKVSLGEHPVILGQNFLLVAIDKKIPPEQFTDIISSGIDSIEINPIQLALQGMLSIANKNAPRHISNVIKNKHLMAGLLLELSEDSNTSKLATRTLQELSAEIVTEWSLQDGDRFKIDLLEAPNIFLKNHASTDIGNKSTENAVYFELNRHLCSFSSIRATHLTTGLILHDESEYWVVLNCSCDLVPDQDAFKWKNSIRDFQPFTALKLVKSGGIESALQEATKGRHVFINDGEKSVILSYPPYPDNPHHETFFAYNNGIFSDFTVQTMRFCVEAGPDQSKVPILKTVALRVVAQMRYEYATRFLNMLCAHNSRVGVDFVTPPKSVAV